MEFSPGHAVCFIWFHFILEETSNNVVIRKRHLLLSYFRDFLTQLFLFLCWWGYRVGLGCIGGWALGASVMDDVTIHLLQLSIWVTGAHLLLQHLPDSVHICKAGGICELKPQFCSSFFIKLIFVMTWEFVSCYSLYLVTLLYKSKRCHNPRA